MSTVAVIAAASVIIVTFNHVTEIGPCLDAVLATVPVGTEVIVVDNASVDGTPEVVERAFPAVRVLRAETNLGYGGANNLAARHATGDVLVFLNPDTRPRPGWLEPLLEEVRRAPGRVLATPKLLLMHAPDRIDTVGNDVHIGGITPSRGWSEPASRYGDTHEVSAVSGACFALSKRLFEQLGGFAERLFLYYEDTELSLRARLAGARCVAVGASVVLHDHRPGFSPSKLLYLERNRWWTLLTVYRWRTLAALMPVLLLSEAVAWAMAVIHGPLYLGAKARAWSDLARWLPDLPGERRRVQRVRTVSDAALLRHHSVRLHVAQVSGSVVARLGETVSTGLFAAGRALALALGDR